MESARIVSRTPYRAGGARTRDRYHLTQAGEELLPILMSLVQWGDAHLQDSSAPLTFVDSATGETIRVCVSTAADREVGADDIEIRATL